MPNLPFELVEDILRRLPVKSLKRFRVVSKTWCCLIDSQDFIELHHRQSLISGSRRGLIMGGLGVHTLDLETLDKPDFIKPPFYYKSNDGISNSCNGIVLAMSDPPVLWNVFSNEVRVLPNCSTDMQAPVDSFSKTIYGFGYDSVNDEYKVVRVEEFRDKTGYDWIASETKIYGTKSNSWRQIEDFPYPLPFLKGNWRVHVNGALHTLAEDPSDGAVIVAFNVRTEKHSLLKLPPGIRIHGANVSLDVVDGNLSFVCTRRSSVVVWVMKEYGVVESWFKLLTISPPLMDRNDFVTPLTCSRDGKRVLLIFNDTRFVWYDLGKKSVEERTVEGLPFVFHAEVCVETLVRINGGVEEKRKVLPKEKKKGKNRSKRRDDFLSEGFKLVL